MKKPPTGTIIIHFFRHYSKPAMVTSGMLVFAGVLELLGITAFLPLIQFLLRSDIAADDPGFFVAMLDRFGLPYDFLPIAGILVALFVGKAVFLALAMRYVSGSVTQISNDLRMRHVRAMVTADWGYFVSHRSGQSLNAISVESFQAASAFLSTARLAAVTIQVVVYSISAAMIDWKLTIGAFLSAVFVGAVFWVWLHIARKAGFHQMQMAKDMLIGMTDLLQGIKPLKAMGRETMLMDFMTEKSSNLRLAQFRQMTSIQYLRILSEPIMMMVLLAGIWFVFADNQTDIAVLGVMVVIFYRLMTGINGVQGELQRLSTQEASYWSLLETIGEAEAAAQDWAGSAQQIDGGKDLSFDQVHFVHANKTNHVLDGITFTIPNKSFTVLTGSSGSGKTTCLDLICGFYQPTDGQVLYGDVDIRQLDITKWRGKLGFVPQEVMLFNASIRYNVSLERPDIDDQQIWQALEAAEAADFVRSLPNGLDSLTGEGGRSLSGGQRQRIAIARAIVESPEILLLDEATSALDADTEQSLLHTIQKLSSAMTIIAVTHSRAVKNAADQVFALDQGRIEH